MEYNYFNIINGRTPSDFRAKNMDMPVNGAFPAQTPLAMAYVPFQSWEEPYDDKTGFDEGTIFPQLNQPFLCGGGS
ncbi:MAG: spore coat associated protein CotJA [Oscillospiraceae bacterium]|nr:spore coat associated protein CotJA [Oscillospiraceae bacterium]